MEILNIIPHLRYQELLKDGVIPDVFRKHVATVPDLEDEKSQRSVKLAFVIDPKNDEKVTYEGINSNCDISSSDMIINTVRVGDFNLIRDQESLRILGITAMRRKLKVPTRHVGIYLILQGDMIFEDLEKWESDRYLRILQSVKKDLSLNLGTSIDDYVALSNLYHHIGYTVQKDSIPELVRELPAGSPLQAFLRPRITTKLGYTPLKDQVGIRNQILGKGLRCFSHTPYTINLSNIEVGWNIELLKSELRIAHDLGFLGAVVHVGKWKTGTDMDEKKGLKNMIDNIILTLKDWDSKRGAMLLIETPAGQGSELGTNIEGFMKIYETCSTACSPGSLGICIDTCHVFASGYHPDDYIRRWNLSWPGTIKLIHFNGSEDPRGSRKDRHAHPMIPGTENKIPLKSLLEACRLGIELNIPMVRE